MALLSLRLRSYVSAFTEIRAALREKEMNYSRASERVAEEKESEGERERGGGRRVGGERWPLSGPKARILMRL